MFGGLCFLLLLLILFASVPIYNTAAQTKVQPSHSEVIMTVSAGSIPNSNIEPKDYTFVTKFVISNYIQNNLESEMDLEIPENLIGWSFENYSIYDVTIFDNLNNKYEPVLQSEKVSNPTINVVIPSHFEYKISISFFTTYGVFFDTENLVYIYHFGAKWMNPIDLSIKFPKSYSLLQFTSGGKIEENEQYLSVNWEDSTEFNIAISFLPFSLNGIINSFKATVDLATVFPAKGQVCGTIEETILIPIKLDIWKITPALAIHIAFPGYSRNIIVKKVWDGTGECTELLQPVQNPDAVSYGHYFVDFEQRMVVVYPHYSYGGEFYQFEVGVTFVTPHDYEPFKMEAARQKLPFQYESYFIIDEIQQYDNWKLNVTGNLEVKFILPKDASPIPQESGNPIIGEVDGRPTATFVYNSPKTLFPSSWHIIYDIVTMRNCFWLSIISLILTIIMICILMFLKFPSASLGIAFQLGISGLISGLMLLNIQTFLGLGGFENTLTALFATDVSLWAILIAISIWKTNALRNRRQGTNTKPK
jgi:hypothetical protein